MSVEAGEDDRVEIVATIKESSGAIAFDGESGEGGKVTLAVPGSDVAGLARLLMLRGKRLRVTFEAWRDPVQEHLDLAASMGAAGEEAADDWSEDGRSEDERGSEAGVDPGAGPEGGRSAPD